LRFLPAIKESESDVSQNRRNRVRAQTAEKLIQAPIWTPIPTNKGMSNTLPPDGRATRRQASEDEIRLCAYHKWEKAGKPPGDGVQFWLEAEQESIQAT
jgi:hypothetical protein